jgi:cytochrome c peroxidase
LGIYTGVTKRGETMRKSVSRSVIALVILAGAWSLAAAQGGPAPPPQLQALQVPSANPITEEKRLLGKILFWDEQLSGDSTVACGTCHAMGKSGTDGRIGVHPGPDALFGTVDDVRASPGVAHADVLGNPVQDPLFGLNRQVTRRSANAAVIAAYSPELFWDGRAGTAFFNPETGTLSIASGAALENQAIGPVLSTVEMGRDQRSWADVALKLKSSEPLGTATGLPSDVLPLVASHKTYPELFQSAYGDPTITAERIAFAIATYERTLIPDQTPYDRFAAGAPPGAPGSLTQAQANAWNKFRGSPCAACHTPPVFANTNPNTMFRNIGVRPPSDDTGRREVTGLFQDRGKFKVPTLRGVGLKTTFMHNGVFSSLNQVIAHYRPNNPAIFLENIDPALPVPVLPQDQPDLIDFLANGLTDPRVRDQVFPFDQPAVHDGRLPQLSFDANKTTMRWPLLQGVSAYVMVRGNLSDLVDLDHDGLPDLGYGDCVSGSDPNTADAVYVDNEVPSDGNGFFYLKGVRDGATIRGLGVTSAVRQRVPAVSCP